MDRFYKSEGEKIYCIKCKRHIKFEIVISAVLTMKKIKERKSIKISKILRLIKYMEKYQIPIP